MTRYVVIGAGAIGSALGGFLAARGGEVLAVARGEHARAMTEAGLHVRCPDTAFTVAVPTVTGPDGVHLSVDDVLVLTTKTQQAAAAVDEWADVPVHDRAGAVVGRAGELLPIAVALNGVAGEEIALRWFDRVLAVCVWFPVVLIEPGEVIVRCAPRRGLFHVGGYGAPADPALLDGLERDWDPAGLRILRPEQVMAWKYRKLLSNLGNAVQALLGDLDDVDDVLSAAGVEARSVLDAAGIAVIGDDESGAVWADLTVAEVPGEPTRLGGSSWQSLVRGGGTIETGYLNGEIALTARRIGRTAPVNARLADLSRRAAREGWSPGSIDADTLRAALGL